MDLGKAQLWELRRSCWSFLSRVAGEINCYKTAVKDIFRHCCGKWSVLLFWWFFFPFDSFSYREQSVSGWPFRRKAGKARRVMPRVGQTDPGLTNPRGWQELSTWLQLELGMGHWQLQTQQGMKQLQGPPTGSWQQHQQTGPGTAWSTGPKGPFSRWATCCRLSKDQGQAEVEPSTAQTRTSSTGLTQNGPVGRRWVRAQAWLLREVSSHCPQAPDNFMAFSTFCLFATAAFDSWKPCPLCEMWQKKQKWRIKSSCPISGDTWHLFLSPHGTVMKDTSLSRGL